MKIVQKKRTRCSVAVRCTCGASGSRSGSCSGSRPRWGQPTGPARGPATAVGRYGTSASDTQWCVNCRARVRDLCAMRQLQTLAYTSVIRQPGPERMTETKTCRARWSVSGAASFPCSPPRWTPAPRYVLLRGLLRVLFATDPAAFSAALGAFAGSPGAHDRRVGCALFWWLGCSA